MLETTWVDAQNKTHTVQTTQEDGETVDQWVARHTALVNALQEHYPPV